MNKTKILSISVFVLLSVSCSVQRGVTYSARTEQLSPQIIQMPTVTELDVSQTPVIADTVVSRHPFKKSVGYQSKKDVTDALIASVLKETGSDILMEPDIKTEVTQKGFSSSLKVELKGYPAKYKNFRTITMEDIDVLNALKKEKKAGSVNYSKFIRSNAGKNYLKADNLLGISNGMNTALKPVAGKAPWRRKLGYTAITEFGAMGVDMTSVPGFETGGGLSIMTSHGSQIKPWLFIGGSIGANFDFDYSTVIVPIAVNSRFYLLNRRFSPYWNLKVGVAPRVDIESSDSFWAGYVSAGFGLAIGNFSLGFNFDNMLYFNRDVGQQYMTFTAGLAF